MKKIFLIVTVVVATFSFSSCCNENKCDNKEADQNFHSFQSFVLKQTCFKQSCLKQVCLITKRVPYSSILKISATFSIFWGWL